MQILEYAEIINRIVNFVPTMKVINVVHVKCICYVYIISKDNNCENLNVFSAFFPLILLKSNQTQFSGMFFYRYVLPFPDCVGSLALD